MKRGRTSAPVSCRAPPTTAAVDDGELSLGGIAASALAAEYGTPLVVYCEETLLASARAYQRAAPDALVAYSVKAFPSVALLRLFGAEGLGADVSTLGELEYATRADIPGERIVVHGNNKSGKEIEAEARASGLEPAGLHVHIGSQLLDTQAARTSVDWLAGFAADCRAELDWAPEVVDLGGGLGIQYVDDEKPPAIEDFVAALRERLEHEWRLHGLSPPRIVLEPGRSLVGRAGVTLYRVGVVKQASETLTYVAVDGGMSDNPRPQLYGARYTAVLANRASDGAHASYAVCGKHCESGDVLIERVRLPAPRRGDVLAVPGTGAYTLGMGSNYNGVARPAAVLVRDGRARVIRRRETLDDLLAFEG